MRILAAVSVCGALGLPLGFGAGVAGAQPSTCPQPAPTDPAIDAAPCSEPPRDATGSDGLALSPALSNQINQAVGNLPSPVELNVPVSVGFGLGLPGIALPGLSVPVVLGSLPAPQLPQIGPPQLPGIGIPQLPF